MLKFILPIFIIVVTGVRHATAAFNATAVWDQDYIAQNEAGTFCYFPGPNPLVSTSCSGGHFSDPQLSNVLAAHLKTRQAIGYYDVNNVRLGGPEFSVQGPVWFCGSGRRVGGSVTSFCEPVSQDNEFETTASFCAIEVGQTQPVTDGCYTQQVVRTQSAFLR